MHTPSSPCGSPTEPRPTGHHRRRHPTDVAARTACSGPLEETGGPSDDDGADQRTDPGGCGCVTSSSDARPRPEAGKLHPRRGSSPARQVGGDVLMAATWDARLSRPGSPVCAPAWLSLREDADAAARSPDLVELVRGHLAVVAGRRPSAVIRDLGC